MNPTTCTTRACTIEELNPNLKNALRAHGKHFGLEDIESDVLMCRETISILQKNGVFNTRATRLSAVYITPKWLVWAIAPNGNAAHAGSAQL